MANVTLLDGFGINVDRNSHPYAPARHVFDCLTKTLESINKIPQAKVSGTPSIDGSCVCVSSCLFSSLDMYVRRGSRIGSWRTLGRHKS